MSGVRIRAAVAGNLEDILRLERGSEAPHWAAGEYEAILGGGGVPRCLLVAEVDEELVGFAVGKALRVMEEVVGELETVVVADSARRRGVGRSLCGAVLDWCGGQGAGLVELEVREGNAGAITLYRQLGFEVEGRRRGYYREPVEDGVLMRLKLGPGSVRG